MILAARDLALWALAVLPAAHALLAWRATSPAVVGVLGVLCALGQGIALPVGSRAFAGVAAVGRGRARVLLGLAHSGLALSAPVVAAAAPGLLPRITLLFAWLQVPALLLAASESGVLATLMNAGVLVALAALHGGLPAASAATCFLLVLPLFLTFDHWARTLASHPHARVPPFRVVLREALGLALPAALGAAAFFLLLPPRPAESVLVAAAGAVRAEPIGAAHRLLIFALLLGGIGILTVVRLFRRAAQGAAPTVEALEVIPLEDEALPVEVAPLVVPHAGARARILRAYLRFLADAARSVARRRAPETPREFARRVRGPSRPIGSLTELFMNARYGAEEPGEGDALTAERAMEEIRAAWRGRR